MSFKVYHLGAENCVTGSSQLLSAKDIHILIDCGMVQGKDSHIPITSWPVRPDKIDYLFLTHAHIDHIGRLPELIDHGFDGEIITTHPTKALLGPMLQNALSFTDYSERDQDKLLSKIDELSWGFEFNEQFGLKKGLQFRLGRAGHILGSCFVQISSSHFSVVFSGDLGPKNTPILCEPDIPDPCDVLVLESTYGDRFHADRTKRIEQLGKILSQALSDNGKVYIPSFALGRSQELIYEMDRLFTDPHWQVRYPSLTKQIPVFIDSPLGTEITKIYSKLSPFWDKEARELLRRGDHPIDFDHLYIVESHHHHRKLLEMDGPAIIIAGSGMCHGGRIVNHLKQGLERSENDVLFVGYQAKGTPGRDIIKYSRYPSGYVRIEGERLDINAKIYQLSGYSAHADQADLVDWVRQIPEKPGKIKLVHGELNSQTALYKALDV